MSSPCTGWSKRAVVLGALLAALCVSTAARAIEDDDAPLPTDPRVIEANSLLGEDAQRQHVIRLYAEVLAENPENDTARMWLARVLSWDGQYDASLAHYERFLRREEPPDWAARERAAVLSWAGRYDEAEAAFQEILDRDPRNAAAMRGLARVYQWSGRNRDAARAYERALAIEEDAGARRDLESLYANRANQGESVSDFFTDSDDFVLSTTTVRGSADLDLSTRILARSSYSYVEMNRSGNPRFDPLSDEEDSTQGFDALVGIERNFGRGLVARVLAGGRRWDGAPSTALVEAELEWTVAEGLATGLSLDYGDFLSRSHSLDSVIEGVDAVTLRGWTWASLLPVLGVYGYAEGSFIGHDSQSRTELVDPAEAAFAGETEDVLDASGRNERVAWGVSFDVTPFPKLGVGLVLGADFSHYRDDSVLFYDPHFAADGTLALRGKHRFTEWLELEASVGGGYGYALQDGEKGDGFTYQISGGPTFTIGGLWVAARAARSVSQRATTYDTWGASLNMGMSF
jgi:tetratricopeptide (TPR) repeat protein